MSIILRRNRKLLSKICFQALSTNAGKQTNKQYEEPVIVIAENDDVHMIGPPHPVSNLRPIVRKILPNETQLQRQLREMHNATQEWNQQFWITHNTNFVKERENYIKQKQPPGSEYVLSAEEMSEFYKHFLDKNWETHLKYNVEWYKRNFKLLSLAFTVFLEKFLNKLR